MARFTDKGSKYVTYTGADKRGRQTVRGGVKRMQKSVNAVNRANKVYLAPKPGKSHLANVRRGRSK